MRIRSIANLRAFEAAARHRSFTQAACELNVTQAAISHRIKQLESELGIALFDRQARQIVLTEAGKTFLPAVSEVLHRLQQATHELAVKNVPKAATLNVLAMQAFATLWLVPRLGHFRKCHPEIDIQLVSWIGGLDYMDESDFQQHGIDLTILYTDRPDRLPGLRAELLGKDFALPVCNPKLMSSPHPLRSLENLRYHTIVHALTWPGIWSRWFAAAGSPEIMPTDNVTFQNSLLTIQGALSGVGVAMAHKLLVAEHIASGRLIAPFALELPVDHAYYFVSRRQRRIVGSALAFKEWLQAEFAVAIN
jgi:LysR family glycine cleavage system transcriptional activator